MLLFVATFVYLGQFFVNTQDLLNTKIVISQFDNNETEMYLTSNNVTAKFLTSTNDKSIIIVTTSNGESLVQIIYNSQLAVKYCYIVENREITDNFTKEVKDNIALSSSVEYKDDFEDKLKLMKHFNQHKLDCLRFQRNVYRLKQSKAKMSENSRRKRSYLILPGTNWCGKGSSADYAQQLGLASDVDICCRTHDQCPFAIEGFSSRFNLFNYRLHTLSHCDCDQQFKECLKNSNTGTANVVGKVYFNIVNTQCFDLKLEKVCARHSWWGTCSKSTTQWVATTRSLGNF